MVACTCSWTGIGVDEVGIAIAGRRKGDVVVRVNAKYFRPTEVDLLLGNPSKAKTQLHWDPLATPLEVSMILIKCLWLCSFKLVANLAMMPVKMLCCRL